MILLCVLLLCNMDGEHCSKTLEKIGSDSIFYTCLKNLYLPYRSGGLGWGGEGEERED